MSARLRHQPYRHVRPVRTGRSTSERDLAYRLRIESTNHLVRDPHSPQIPHKFPTNERLRGAPEGTEGI